MRTMKKVRMAIAGIGLLFGMAGAAGIAVDLDATTPSLDTVLDISAHKAGDTLLVGVICLAVTNLDSYSFYMGFDSTALKFLRGAADFPGKTLDNIISVNPDATLISTGFKLLTGKGDTLNAGFSLTGEDSSLAPEGSGLIAAAMFRIVSLKNSEISLRNARLVDYVGTDMTVSQVFNGRLLYTPTGIVQAPYRSDFHFTGFIIPSYYYTLNGRTVNKKAFTAPMIFMEKTAPTGAGQNARTVTKVKR
jgi:hypothetical protein